MRSANIIRLTIVLALCLLVPACKSKVSKTNFEKIKDGMALEEVEKILGKGTSKIRASSAKEVPLLRPTWVKRM